VPALLRPLHAQISAAARWSTLRSPSNNGARPLHAAPSSAGMGCNAAIKVDQSATPDNHRRERHNQRYKTRRAAGVIA
jgi:hypothetical protein